MKNSMKHKFTLKQIVLMLLCFSAVMYVVHYLIFRDFHHIAIFFVHDIAFMPLEVILVTLFFDRIIEKTNEEENRAAICCASSPASIPSPIICLRSCRSQRTGSPRTSSTPKSS